MVTSTIYDRKVVSKSVTLPITIVFINIVIKAKLFTIRHNARESYASPSLLGCAWLGELVILGSQASKRQWRVLFLYSEASTMDDRPAKNHTALQRDTDRCASGCVVECRISNREVSGSNLSLELRTEVYSAFHPSGVGK